MNKFLTLILYSNKKFFTAFFFVLGYAMLFYTLQFFLAETHFLQTIPNEKGITNWDCNFYRIIKENGYSKNDLNTSGFFILFPLIWKVSGLSVWGISALNIFFFALGFAVLMKTLNNNDKLFWLFLLTIPPTCLTFIPLTEALFFLLGSLALYAIKEKKDSLLMLIIFFIALVRATTLFILPALFVMEILSSPLKDWKKGFVRACKFAIPSIIGLFIFIWWQYLQTGIWFVYFKIQAEHWDKGFSVPEFPLKNIEGGEWRYHWLSALALLMCFTCILFLIRELIRWVNNKSTAEKNTLFSATFLGMVVIFILFFNPVYDHSTRIMSANRYTFITPFCFYMLHHWYKEAVSYRRITLYLVLSNAFFTLFGALADWHQYFLIGFIPTLIIAAFMLCNKSRDWLFVCIIGFSFLFQMLYFQQYLQNIFLD